jgi:unsaturated rhamnogalacturonyl hydrolase
MALLYLGITLDEIFQDCYMKKLLACLWVVVAATHAFSQAKSTDGNAPLHLSKPDYAVPYNAPSTASVKAVLDRVFNYLDAVTPAAFANKKTGAILTDYKKIDTETVFQTADYRLTSYEWGVTYSGMLEVAAATGDERYSSYTKKRLHFLADALAPFKQFYQQTPHRSNPMKSVIHPEALDDAGALCAAIVKTIRLGEKDLQPLADNFSDFVSNKQFRLADRTLARNRPYNNSLWLDDMYMSIPCIAQMGKLTGDTKYYDDAVRQVKQFSGRMFNKDMGIYMHGWIEGMTVHPEFHWARANGWAFMAMAELLDVLPANHPGRADVLAQFQAHAKGLVAYQSGKGFWHQLLDRNDSYLETSATAIYTYCLARGINNGWLDAMTYSGATILGWNAVTTEVNEKGEVEGTCVGTGMAFDPAFYYYRPVNKYAAHGYGPVLLAGAEMIRLLKNYPSRIDDSALLLEQKDYRFKQ